MSSQQANDGRSHLSGYGITKPAQEVALDNQCMHSMQQQGALGVDSPTLKDALVPWKSSKDPPSGKQTPKEHTRNVIYDTQTRKDDASEQTPRLAISASRHYETSTLKQQTNAGNHGSKGSSIRDEHIQHKDNGNVAFWKIVSKSHGFENRREAVHDASLEK